MLRARIGAGGMGEVYRARDPELGRDVAVKLLPARFTDDAERLARFSQEARAASALNHPNIVTIHEIGTYEGRPFLVLEFVEGVTLRALISAEAPLPPGRVFELGAQIAEGLARAHTAGIVHRDLKPENVMIRPDGLVKILDFGLAKLYDQHSGGGAVTLTGTHSSLPVIPSPETIDGVILGTVGYMSPEQAQGVEVDFRSDQFVLGAILYELLTGRRAFQRATAVQTMAAILDQEPEPLAQLVPELSAAAGRIVERCLAKEPAARFTSTFELARALRAESAHSGASGMRSGSGVTSGVPGDLTAITAPLGKRSGRWAALALFLVLLTLLGVVWMRGRPHPEGGERAPLPAVRRVVVLPFHVVSDLPADRFFADGLVESLTARLSLVDGSDGGQALSIVPAADVRAAGVTSAETAHRIFGATLVLSGGVQRRGEMVRLHAVLVDAAGLQQLRVIGPRDYRLDDLARQDRFVADAAELLELERGAAAGPQPGATGSGTAYERYLEARGHLQQFERRESVETAISQLQEALAADPQYALAHAALGEGYWRLYELTKRTELVAIAREAATRALAIEDLQAQVHLTLGMLARGTGDPEGALAEFVEALDRDPRLAEAERERGRALADLGRPEEAAAAYHRALALRETDWATHNYLGALLVGTGDLEAAAAEFREVSRLAPDNPRGFTNLGVVAFKLGELREAERALRRSVEIRPTPLGLTNLGTTLYYRGRFREAADAFARAVAGDERNASAWLNLGRARWRAEPEAAATREALRRAVTLNVEQLAVNPRDARLLIEQADARMMLGETPEARALALRAVALAPDDGEIAAIAAWVHEELGDREAALAYVAAAVAAGYPRWELEHDPAFARLRTDPRFPAAVTNAPAADS